MIESITGNSAFIVPEIITEKFVLTVLSPDKASLIHEYYLKNKMRLKKYEPVRNIDFYTLDSWEARIKDSYSLFLAGKAVNFVALDIDKKEMIGSCNFTNIVMGVFMACHIGFSISGEFEGKGLMRKIVSEGINYIFKIRGLHRIMANYLPSNVRSEALLKRLGFEKEGYAKSYLKINGIWKDHVLTSLISES